MKKSISVLLILMMLLALTACGAKHEAVVATQPIDVTPTGATLSPREQFQQQKEAMNALLNKSESGEENESETETEAVEAVQSGATSSFSAGGITLQLDSSFTAQYDEGEELMTYWHRNGDSFSYTMKIGITLSANYAGYKTSQEAAEAIAAQKPDVRTVESANGVYYIVQTGQLNVIKAYYVDDSGYIWIVDGMTSTSVNFADYKDQLIQFCTSGSID